MTRKVLFLPGMMLDHRMWSGQVAALQDAFCCRVGELAGANAIGDLADHLLESAPGRFHLVGFSLGAIVSMAMWRKDPGRIASLTLMGFSPYADDPARKAAREQQVQRARNGGLAEVVRKELAPRYFSPSALPDRVQRWTASVVEMASDLGPEVFSCQTQAQITRPDSVGLLASVGVPTLVMRGEDDRLVAAADLELLKQQLPRAQAAAVPACGHMLTLEQPAAVNRLLHSFLTRNAHDD